MKDQSDCCGSAPDSHPDYNAELMRLNRIAGQVDGVRKMIADKRYCPDILNQLRAIRAAVDAVEAAILDSHLESCVTQAFAAGGNEDRRAKLDELKSLYRRYA